MKKHYRHETDCLNCGADLQGHFCHNCGQENLEMKESFGHMMSHAISDYFHFDYQFFHTLKPLLFKPGRLTKEYMSGHRISYLHPVKMYIFISVVYFLLLFQTGSGDDNKWIPVKATGRTEQIKELDSTNTALKAAVNEKYMPASARSALQTEIKDNVAKIAKLKADTSKKSLAEDSEGMKRWDGKNGLYGVPVYKFPTYQAYLDTQAKLPTNKRDDFIGRLYSKKMIVYHQKYGDMAKETLIEELKHNIPKMMFIILPLFALILKLSFTRNRKLYVEHMIFSFHFHCFVFLFLAMLMVIQLIIPQSWGVMEWIYLAGTLYIIWYIYKALRLVYERGRFRTITKMIGMSLAYFAVFMLCFCIALFITALFTIPSE